MVLDVEVDGAAEEEDDDELVEVDLGHYEERIAELEVRRRAHWGFFFSHLSFHFSNAKKWVLCLLFLSSLSCNGNCFFFFLGC